MEEQKELSELYESLIKSESDFLHCIDILSDVIGKKKTMEFKRKALKKWFIQEFPSLLPPNDEQCDAILDSGINTLVTARAGSGKTTLLVYRVLYLLRCRHVQPNVILLLAFNKSAAVLIRERLFRILVPPVDYEQYISRAAKISSRNYNIRERLINECLAQRCIALPHIMTFHALAYRIVRPTSNQFLITEDVSSLNMYCFNEVLGNKLSDPKSLEEYSDLLLHCFAGCYGSSKESFYSVDGTRVDTSKDLEIANFLFACRIHNEYVSRPADNHSYFQIFNGDLNSVAIVRNWSGVMSSFEKAGRQCITLENADFDNFCRLKDKVKLELLADFSNLLGRKIVHDSADTLFARCEYARERMIKSFQSMILLCKHRCLTPELYIKKCEQNKKKSREMSIFCRLFGDFYREYEKFLITRDCYDFLRLFERATAILRDEQREDFFTDRLQYIMADEFQDFSTSYYQLLEAIRNRGSSQPNKQGLIANNSVASKSPNSKKEPRNTKFMAVGDNWQAINGYAGADVQYFIQFEKFFEQANRLNLLSNYRSERKIIYLSNKVMEGLGDPAIPIKKELGNVYLIAGTEKNDGSSVLVRIFELASYLVQRITSEETIVILVRTQSEANKLRQNITSPFINIQTVHSYKGSEADFVIIDVSSWMFPLIHPDSVYAESVGLSNQMIIAEEKRLMYVALTRARKELYLVADSYDLVSSFLKDFKFSFDRLEGEQVPDSLNAHGNSWKQSVQAVLSGKTYDVKEKLKELGYRYNPAEKSWCRKYASAELFEQDFVKYSFSSDKIYVELFDYVGKPIPRNPKPGYSFGQAFQKSARKRK